jgi:hypothetical protein
LYGLEGHVNSGARTRSIETTVRLTALLLLAAMVAIIYGCASGDDDFEAQNILQRTVRTDSSETLTLQAGDTLAIPAGTFAEDTVVLFANVLTGADGNLANYPEGTGEGDLVGAAVINTPVDQLFEQNITLTFDLIQPGEDRTPSVVTAGQQLQLWRFDFDHVRWQPWGSLAATVSSNAQTATVTLPTNGFRGFIGSLALFDGELAGDTDPTTIAGTVVDQNGNGVATDVGLYVAVAGRRYPVAVTNGRVPTLNDQEGQPITVANTVNSGSDGHFSMQIPDHLIGQVVGLSFGAEDTAWGEEQTFDLLAPAEAENGATSMIVLYGANNVRSAPLRATSN